MMRLRQCLYALSMLGPYLLGGCQTAETQSPAVLAADDPQVMAELKSVLATAMKTARIELGPGDLTQTSTISVLPPHLGPLEGRSPAMPTQFDLVKTGKHCAIIRRDTGDQYDLPGITCRSQSQ